MNRLRAEFSMQLSNVNNKNEHSQITISIRNKNITADIVSNNTICVKSKINLYEELIFIDDPFILDELRNRIFFRSAFNIVNTDEFKHRNQLRIILSTEKSNTTNIEEISTTKKLEKIFEQFRQVFEGEMLRQRGKWVYHSKLLKEDLDIQNISTGLKTFTIIKTLLMNGNLKENGVIVLDEPEIHLHPEWQLVLAEIIVLIQKEFNMHILLTTHSSYFLDAIETAALKHGTTAKCKYYLVEDKCGTSVVEDVTNNTGKIYDKFIIPLQKMENIRDEYD